MDRRHRCVAEPRDVACDDDIAPGGGRGRGADSVFEIGPAQGKGACEDCLVDGRHIEDRQGVRDDSSRSGGATRSRQEMEQGRDAMSRQEADPAFLLDRGPEACGRVNVRRAGEQRVERHVDVNEKALHRYLRSRYLR